MITLYLLGLLTTQTILVIWFFSPFRVTLAQILYSKEIMSTDEVETILLCKYPILGKLLSCYICFSFWTSILIGMTGVLFFSLPLFVPIITGLTYPSLCYLYKSIVD